MSKKRSRINASNSWLLQYSKPRSVTEDVGDDRPVKTKPKGTITKNPRIVAACRGAVVASLLGYYWSAREVAGLRRYDNGATRTPIYSLGRMMVGQRVVIIGLAWGCRQVFMATGSDLWQVPDLMLHEPAPHLGQFKGDDPDAFGAYADELLRSIGYQLQPAQKRAALERAHDHYNLLCRAVMREAILSAAERGVMLDVETMARSIGPNWSARDLTHARFPSIRHALLLTLVCAVPAARAAPLIEMAIATEMGGPLITSFAAQAIYSDAAQTLARLVPAWGTYGVTTDWLAVGCLESHLLGHFVRVASDAEVRNIPWQHAVGMPRAYSGAVDLFTQPSPDEVPLDGQADSALQQQQSD